MFRLVFAGILFSSISLIRPIYAADQDARVQQAMRAMTARLRAAETERDNLQAAKVQSDQEKKALTEKYDALAKQAKADGEALAAIKTRVTELEGENAQMKDSLQKLEASQGHAVEIA